MEQPEEYLDPDACFTEGARGKDKGGTAALAPLTGFCWGRWWAEAGGSVAIFRSFVPYLIILRGVDIVSLVWFLPVASFCSQTFLCPFSLGISLKTAISKACSVVAVSAS